MEKTCFFVRKEIEANVELTMGISRPSAIDFGPRIS